MKKSKKLNLDELEVQSFVTAFDMKNGQTVEIKGGTHASDCGHDYCDYSQTCEPVCPTGHCGSDAQATVCCGHTLPWQPGC